MTNSGARNTAPCAGTGNWFALLDEFPNVKSMLHAPSPNVEDAASEHSGVEGPLAQLEWEYEILLDQAVVMKQTLLRHTENIGKLERTMCEIFELILEARQKEESPKPTGPAPRVGQPPPPEVIMRGESFPMPPPAPQILVQHSAHAKPWREHANPFTGLPPAAGTLMAGEPFPILPPAPQLLAKLDTGHGHSHPHDQHHHQHHHQHHPHHHQHHHRHHQLAPPDGYGRSGHKSQL